MKKSKLMLIATILVAAVALLASCGSGNNLHMSMAPAPAAAPVPGGAAPAVEAQIATEADSLFGSRAFHAAVDMPEELAERDHGGRVDWEDIAETNERHIIQTANVHLENEYFDETVDALRLLAPAANGYISSEMLTGHGQRMFTIVLRVPAAEFDNVLQNVQSLGEVRLINSRAEDVTDRFYDMAGNLETRRIEEERLLALIEEATSVTDILALETRLSDTRLIIERYLSQLNMMAAQIAYSTIHVQLTDTADHFVPLAVPSVGERIGGAFGDSVDGTINTFQNLIVFIAGAVIPLAFLGLLGFAIFAAVRGIRKKIKAREA